MSLEHQDFKIITLGKNNKNVSKTILPRNNDVDLHKIKVENESENFQILKIPEWKVLSFNVLKLIKSPKKIAILNSTRLLTRV